VAPAAAESSYGVESRLLCGGWHETAKPRPNQWPWCGRTHARTHALDGIGRGFRQVVEALSLMLTMSEGISVTSRRPHLDRTAR
jgi:hypothetical protein